MRRLPLILMLASSYGCAGDKGNQAEGSVPEDTGQPSDSDGADTWGGSGSDSGSDSSIDTATDVDHDNDNDGSPSSLDCDDDDPAVNPSAVELCDGIDNDCDGATDEPSASDATTWYTDADADGYGDPDGPIVSCDPPSNAVEDATDCDDSLSAVNPGASEICSNGIDDDCDGAASGCTFAAETSLDSADLKLVGISGNDEGGTAIALGSDLDGDGRDDPVVGSWRANDGSTDEGAVYVVNGGEHTGILDLSRADYTLVGPKVADYAGQAIAGGFDLDGDGFDDLLVGARRDDDGASRAGAAYLVSGPVTADGVLTISTAKFIGADADDHVGLALAAGGDYNGDGVADVLLGAADATTDFADEGQAYLFLGPVAGDLSVAAADIVYSGRSSYNQAGAKVALDGDVDADGLADVLIAAPGLDGSGSHSGGVHVLLGEGTISDATVGLGGDYLTLNGVHVNDNAGDAIAYSDLNNDGHDDIVVGAPDQSDAAGTVYVVFGDTTLADSISLSSADARFAGGADDDQVGTALSGRGDLDGDGQLDLCIGAPGLDDGGNASGGVYLLLGPLSGTISSPDILVIGEDSGDLVGTSVDCAGDSNADGYSDILTGGPGDDYGGGDAGAAWLVLGIGL